MFLKKLYKDEKYLHVGTEGGAVQVSNLRHSLLAVFNALLSLLNILNKKLEFCLSQKHNGNSSLHSSDY